MTKYYRLKKDLPTFKAGEEFSLDVEGNLVLSDGETYKIIYHYKELEKFPNILKDWFEKIDIGFYLADSGEIIKYDGEEDPYYLNYRKSIGNDFKTVEEAKKHKKYLIALQTIKDDAKGFVPDWEDWGQDKYYGFYNHSHGVLGWNDACCAQTQGAVCFETKESIEKSFKKHRKEWLIVLGMEDE